MEWQEFVKVGCLDVGCQTSFDGDPQASPSSEDGVLDASNGAISPRGALRGSVAPGKMVPLTLNSLLGKSALSSGAKKDRKESGTKYQKINNTTVPRAISGLITSWRMNADQLVQFAKKSLPNVLKIIADAYSDMLTAGRRKIQQQRQQAYATQRGSGRELTLAQIVYQSFLHSYGLPGIADMHLLAFSCALETYRLQHLRVEYFARFCFEEVPKVELLNYLEFLECLVCDDVSAAFLGMNHLSSPTTPASPRSSLNSRGPSPPQQQQQSSTVATRLRFVPRINVPDKENWQVSVERAQEVAQLCFRDMRKTAVTAFCEQLALLAVSGTSTAVLSVATGGSGNASSTETTTSTANAAAATGGELLLNVDHLLQLVVHEWRDEQTRRERHLLDTFRAGDVNGDGQLTSAEFTQIVLSIDATRELGDILLMYSDTLRRVQCEQLDAQVFLQVAREHELDRAVWLGDGDLYSVVNEVTDMEATWTHVRGFFLGTLEALARDLPAAHFLRVCEGAGCGCLKCLLDGYIGFQKMRREFALSSAPKPSTGRRNSVVGVSSQLVWARFWHLMRQLHDAAAQSDGLVTPWEGSDIVTRETPAPPLAPRILARRRHALPNFLFPDTARISAQISAVHDPEAFDADAINAQFAYLLSHISVKTPEATPHASGGQQKPRRASFPASS
ncbi:hypothetical protein BBJ28_00019810 [Nothophytophthora sp. Chile5]|nr:hypothetical protein BBJ28_00019810 [Nothophytophthora sp. Chile5]